MKKRIFHKLINVCFWCGVNVIGLPIIITHQLALYKSVKMY